MARTELRAWEEGLRRVDRDPVDARAYEALAELAGGFGDSARSAHFAWVAEGLRGAGGEAAEPAYRLSRSERFGLRHPRLRNEGAELLNLAAPLLVALAGKSERTYPGSAFGSNAGPGAARVADALDAAERVLGLSWAHVRVSDDALPALRLRLWGGVHVAVGRDALSHPPPLSRLRFESGKALFSQVGDLLVLLHLAPEVLRAALRQLPSALEGSAQKPEEIERVVEALRGSKRRRLKLLLRHASALDLAELRRAARYSAQRAGLVVAFDLAASLAALKSLGGGDDERLELVRYAASERFFQVKSFRSVTSAS